MAVPGRETDKSSPEYREKLAQMVFVKSIVIYGPLRFLADVKEVQHFLAQMSLSFSRVRLIGFP